MTEAGVRPDTEVWRRGFETSRYGLVPRAISPEMAAIATQYMQILHEYYRSDMLFDERQQSYGRYGEPLGESILAAVHPEICRLTGLDLLPTYSYSRLYTTGGILDRHIDRPSCEVSATLFLGSDIPWPIYVEVNGVPRQVLQQPGDLMVYRGCDLPHWRDPCPASYSVHMFLHFVEQGGPFSSLLYDERPGLGAPQANMEPLRDPGVARKVLAGESQETKPRASDSRSEPRRSEPRRNEPCFCGSGKKYKHCHGAR